MPRLETCVDGNYKLAHRIENIVEKEKNAG